jgi:hypothetical protein
MSNAGSTSSLLNSLMAENLLSGSYVLTQIQLLSDSLKYNTEGGSISYDDYYNRLEKELDEVSRIELRNDVVPGTESQYQIQLSVAMERVNTDCSKLTQHILHFRALLNNALVKSKTLSASFVAWYTLAANEVLEETKAKLPTSAVKALADSEFSRLFSGLNMEVESLVTALNVQMEQIKEHKKSQQEKYKMGQDQANASWVGRLPEYGVTSDPAAQALVRKGMHHQEEDKEDGPPNFVSQRPILNPPPQPPAIPPYTPPEKPFIVQTENHGTVQTEKHGTAVTDQSGTIVSSTVESRSFVADTTTVTSTHPSIFTPPVNTIVFTLPDDVNPELKGTFVKFGSPQPVEILNEPKDVVRGTTPFLPDDEYEAEDGSFQKQVDNFVDSVDQQGEQGPDPVVVNVDKTARDRMEMILAMEAGDAEPLPDVTELDKEIQKGPDPDPLPQDDPQYGEVAEVLLDSPALPPRVVDEKPELKPEDRILSLDDLKKQLEPTPAAVPTPEITPTTTPGAPRRKLILDFDDELL